MRSITSEQCDECPLKPLTGLLGESLCGTQCAQRSPRFHACPKTSSNTPERRHNCSTGVSRSQFLRSMPSLYCGCVVTMFPQRKRSMFLCFIASPPPLRIWPSYKMRSLVDSLPPRLRHRKFTIAQVYGTHIPCVFHPKTTTLLAHPLPFKLETLNTAGISQFRALHCEKYIRFRFTATITRDPTVSTSGDRSLEAEKRIRGAIECVVVLRGGENDMWTMIMRSANRPRLPARPARKRSGRVWSG